mmetsp:Transcript_9249/g.31313  ORF Transcript_9249/g.31313 Transcript_9249/m.31313 type:complete len:519 (-) Transcript_9249:344-1900(-)
MRARQPVDVTEGRPQQVTTTSGPPGSAERAEVVHLVGHRGRGLDQPQRVAPAPSHDRVAREALDERARPAGHGRGQRAGPGGTVGRGGGRLASGDEALELSGGDGALRAPEEEARRVYGGQRPDGQGAHLHRQHTLTAREAPARREEHLEALRVPKQQGQGPREGRRLPLPEASLRNVRVQAVEHEEAVAVPRRLQPRERAWGRVRGRWAVERLLQRAQEGALRAVQVRAGHERHAAAVHVPDGQVARDRHGQTRLARPGPGVRRRVTNGHEAPRAQGAHGRVHLQLAPQKVLGQKGQAPRLREPEVGARRAGRLGTRRLLGRVRRAVGRQLEGRPAPIALPVLPAPGPDHLVVGPVLGEQLELVRLRLGQPGVGAHPFHGDLKRLVNGLAHRECEVEGRGEDRSRRVVHLQRGGHHMPHAGLHELAPHLPGEAAVEHEQFRRGRVPSRSEQLLEAPHTQLVRAPVAVLEDHALGLPVARHVHHRGAPGLPVEREPLADGGGRGRHKAHADAAAAAAE